MRYYDITVPLSADLPVYPGDPQFALDPALRLAHGDCANVSRITLCTHSGTHLDPPRHFSDRGMTVDQVPPERLIGKALVVEITGVAEIGRKDLERLRIKGVERLLLKTDNSELWKTHGFVHDYAALSVDGARFLLEAGVKLVGIDYLSVESVEGDGEIHRLLLDNGVLILEGITLADVTPGEYELICLPLKIKDGDGAPVRALLRTAIEQHAEPGFDPHTSRWPLA